MRYYNSYYPEICPGFKEFFLLKIPEFRPKMMKTWGKLKLFSSLMFRRLPLPLQMGTDPSPPALLPAKLAHWVHSILCTGMCRVHSTTRLQQVVNLQRKHSFFPWPLPACLPAFRGFLPSLIWSAWLWLS